MLIIPYTGSVGETVQLDGSLSFDPEELFCLVANHPWCESGISKYEWDLNNDGNFDDSTIAKPTWTWNTEGIYNIGLIVTDSQPSGPGGTFGEKDISDKSYATVVIKMQEPLLIINGPRVNMTKDRSLIIKWETNRPSNSLIRYGTSPSSYEYESDDSYLNDDVTEHEVILKNIEYGQTYYYALFSDDKSGNTVESKEYNFKFIASSSVDGYNFSNYPIEKEDLSIMFWDSMVRNLNPFELPIYNLYKVLVSTIAQAGGHCFGMSTTSIFYFEDEISKPIGYEESNTIEIPKNDARYNINYYQATQFSSKSAVDILLFGIFDRNWDGHGQQEFQKIKDSIDENKPLWMHLRGKNYLISGVNDVQHSVTPIGYSTRSNSGIIYIYDNTLPYQTREIEVAIDWMNYIDNPYVNEEQHIIFNKFLSFKPEKKFEVNVFKQMLKIFSNKLKENLGYIKSYIIALDCPADLKIVDQYGRVITTLNGETNEIPNAGLISGEEFELYDLPSNLEYTVELVGTGDGKADLSFASKDIILTFDDIPITSLTRGKMYIGRTNSYILSLDNNNDGIIDEYIAPMIDTHTENGYNITFLPPITTMDLFNLKDGRTLPIKFTARNSSTNDFIYDDTVNVTITNSTGHLITFFTNGTGTDSVRINTEEEQYIVNLHTKNYDLNIGEIYAVTVTFGETDSLRGYDITYFTMIEGGKGRGN
jgi:PKD repeat protein